MTLEPRRIGHTFAIAAALFVVTSGLYLLSVWLGAWGASQVVLQVAGAGEASATYVDPGGSERAMLRYTYKDADRVWMSPAAQWVSAIRLRIPVRQLGSLGGAQVSIAGSAIDVSRDDLLSRWKKTETPSEVLLESPPRTVFSDWRPGRYLLNWPETENGLQDAKLVASRLLWPAGVSVAFLLLALGARSLWRERGTWLSRAFLPEVAPAPDAAGWGRWLVLALAVVALALAIVERREPRYFTQDDNRVSLLPSVLYVCHGVAGGLLPTWSPHTFLGCPLFDTGIFCITNPMLYLSWGIASLGLGDETLILDVWSCLHLLLGTAVTFWVARRLGLRPAFAAAGAVSFVLSGYFLIAGRSWFTAPTLTVWLPPMILAAARWREREPTWRWALAAGAVVGGAFHYGNAQTWVYALVVVAPAFAIPAIAGDVPWRRLLWVGAAWVVALAVAAPVLVPALGYAGRVKRQGGLGSGITGSLASLVLPSPLTHGAHPDGFGPLHPEFMGQIYYSGTLLTGAGLLGVLLIAATLAGARGGSAVASRNIWLSCGAIALVLACGPDGFVWVPLSRLPGFNFFNGPFKLLPFLTLFLVLGGGLLLERVFESSGRAGPVSFAAVSCLMLYHASLPLPAFFQWEIPLPYPRFEGLAAVTAGTQRFVPMAAPYTEDPTIAVSLEHSLPNAYGALSTDGYDSSVLMSPENVRASERFQRDPIAAARAYGVRWFLQHRSYVPPAHTEPPEDNYGAFVTKTGSPGLLPAVERSCKSVSRMPALTVWELAETSPLAFSTADPARSLPVRFRCDGATVEAPARDKPGQIVLNVLARPAMRAEADGIPLVTRGDEWDRLLLDVPAKGGRIEVRYEPHWRSGVVASLLLALLGAVSVALLERRPEPRNQERFS